MASGSCASSWTRCWHRRGSAWHLTVSDDGSTDGTPAILDGYAARYPDRVRRVRHEGRFGNARDHFFWLMRECGATYMMFCDQDDVWHPDKVEKTMRTLLEAEDEAGSRCAGAGLHGPHAGADEEAPAHCLHR